MIYKHVSVYNIVEKLYRDYDHQEELDIWDCVEWAAEALEFIGAGQQYEKFIVELDVVNAIATLPCNFHSQPQASYNGKPLNLATGSFSPLANGTSSSQSNVVNGTAVSNSTHPASSNVGSTASNTYYVADGLFVTSIITGTVLLEYRGVKVDKEGYPMIPDLQSYRTAVTTYCQMKMDHKDWRRKRITREVYSESKHDWQWYCKQARGAANMPNLDYMEAMKNQWVKLKPQQNAHSSFYQTSTMREMRKLK